MFERRQLEWIYKVERCEELVNTGIYNQRVGDISNTRSSLEWITDSSFSSFWITFSGLLFYFSRINAFLFIFFPITAPEIYLLGDFISVSSFFRLSFCLMPLNWSPVMVVLEGLKMEED